MGKRANQMRTEMADLLQGRPGWRLEARTTPGATPLWCFVDAGQVEFSVTAESGTIRLYVMATDREIAFTGVEELTAWLRTHRPDAMREVPQRPDGERPRRKLFEWS
jgi:hypothetical protein